MFQGGFEKRCIETDAGIVDEQVDTAKAIARGLSQARGIGFIGNVSLHANGRAAGACDTSCDRGRSFGVHISHHDFGPRFSQAFRRGAPDTPASAGYDGYPISQLHCRPF